MDVRKTNIFTLLYRMAKEGFERTFDQCRVKG